MPLTVDFDATGSSDPNPGDTLTYRWDLDGDGQLDDSTVAEPSFTYNTAGVYTVTLEVTDTGRGLRHRHGDDQRRQRPADGEHRCPHLRDDVARRPDDQLLRVRLGSRGRDAAGVGARLVADHAPLLDADRVPRAPHPGLRNTAGGSFAAPDHEYPSHLELRLTATDSNGNTDTKSLPPRPADVDGHRAHEPRRDGRGGRRGERAEPAPARGDRRVQQHPLGSLAAGVQQPLVRLLLVVERPGPDAHARGARDGHHLHGLIRADRAGDAHAHLQRRGGRVRRGGKPEHQLRRGHLPPHRRRAAIRTSTATCASSWPASRAGSRAQSCACSRPATRSTGPP